MLFLKIYFRNIVAYILGALPFHVVAVCLLMLLFRTFDMRWYAAGTVLGAMIFSLSDSINDTKQEKKRRRREEVREHIAHVNFINELKG